MAVVFTVLMVMAGIYALFKWPIPTLAVLGVLIVIGKSGENKNGGTAPTTAPPPAKPKAPSSPIKPQAAQPTVQAQPKAPEVRKAYRIPPKRGQQQRKLQQRLRNHQPGGQCGQRGGGRNGRRGGDADQGTVLLHQRCPEAELLQERHILFL